MMALLTASLSAEDVIYRVSLECGGVQTLSYQERNDIMKYFDALPQLVSNELEKRGVITDRLLYCVKADLDGEGKYYDVYVTFTCDTLYVISGYEEYRQISGKEKLQEKARDIPVVKSFFKTAPVREMVSYKVVDFSEYDIAKIFQT